MASMSPIKNDVIEGLNPDETMLQVVHKHWFGLFIVYVEVGVGFAAAALLLWFVAPIMYPNAEPTQRTTSLTLIIGVGAILAWLVLILFTYIYLQSKLIITNKNLTQIVQRGLFNRQVSELSMTDVEDVSAVKKGFFPSVFNYGDMLVETAGATDNFSFSFCPNPDYYGKIVLDAREKFIGSNTE